MEKNTVIFMQGPQGSGKGTQAEILQEKLGFSYFESGSLLRQEKNRKLENGQTVGEILASGRLFTDKELFEVVGVSLKSIPPDQGVIFDGIPRRISQVAPLLSLLRKQGKSKFVTLFINIPRSESMKRLLRRAKMEGREDDAKGAINRRLDDYARNTLPMLEVLKGDTHFAEIDGSPSIEKVAEDIFETLELS